MLCMCVHVSVNVEKLSKQEVLLTINYSKGLVIKFLLRFTSTTIATGGLA